MTQTATSLLIFSPYYRSRKRYTSPFWSAFPFAEYRRRPPSLLQRSSDLSPLASNQGLSEENIESYVPVSILSPATTLMVVRPDQVLFLDPAPNLPSFRDLVSTYFSLSYTARKRVQHIYLVGGGWRTTVSCP